MTDIDFYELLECERTADGATIKSSYRQVWRSSPPSRSKMPAATPIAETRFKAISEAYDCPQGPAEARGLRSATATRRFRNRRRSGVKARASSGFLGHLRERVRRISWAAVRAAAARRTTARRRPALRSSRSVSKRPITGKTVATSPIDVAANVRPCATVPAPSRAPHAHRPVATCAGHGKVRAQQGFFVVERACPTCHGAGQVITDPVHRLPRRGARRQGPRRSSRQRSPAGVDEGTRIRI